jgi:hypothetical protein
MRINLLKLNSLFLFVLMLSLVACGREEAAPTLVPPPPATATTAVVGGGQTLEPTPTLVLPTPVIAPATLTPIPTITAAPVAEATATPEAQGVELRTLADFGNNRNPLTGELVANPADLQRRPIAVKISNAPPVYVRPQSGLNQADIVYEHIAEGSVTRLTMVVYGKAPADVGPIRSARLIDLEIPAMYDAAFVFSGASTGVSQRLNQVDFNPRIIRGGAGYYRTGADKPFEHTLYGNPASFWQQLAGLGLNTAPNFTNNMAFSSQTPAGGAAGSAFEIDYRWEVVRWEYDPALGRYRRWAGGQPITDANDGQQVTAANVVVVYSTHIEDPTICEEIRNNACLHLSLQIQIWGSGRAAIFRDGQQYNVTWRRTNRSDMLTFYDEAGNPFPLQIGNSWFQMVPAGQENRVTVQR